MRVPLTTCLPSMTFGLSSIRCIHMVVCSENGCSNSTPHHTGSGPASAGTVSHVDAFLDVVARLGSRPRDETQAFPAKQAQCAV